jgi:hypothetical protein
MSYVVVLYMAENKHGVSRYQLFQRKSQKYHLLNCYEGMWDM